MNVSSPFHAVSFSFTSPSLPFAGRTNKREKEIDEGGRGRSVPSIDISDFGDGDGDDSLLAYASCASTGACVPATWRGRRPGYFEL